MAVSFNPFASPWAGPRRAELIREFLRRDYEADTDGVGESVALLTFVAPPEDQWAFILELLAAAPDDELVLQRIAAGPVEGLLGRFGDKVIPWVEARAAVDHKFRRVLREVWRHMMSDEVWARVCAARERSDA